MSRTVHQLGTRTSADLLMYLVLTLLTLGAWQFSRLEYFKAGDDIGYWIGVAGGVMMLMLLTYPLRKYFSFTRNWGRVKWWFWVHVTLGVAGPLLILVHSTFRVGSLNAAVALYSMIIVALSGVVGRFFYTRIHRGLHGEITTLRALQAHAGFDQSEAASRLQFAPTVEARLLAFEQRELHGKPNSLTYLRQVAVLPAQLWLTYWACAADLNEPLRAIARHREWTPQDHAKRVRQSRKLVRRYLSSVVRVAQFTAYERVFAMWHLAHVPFVYVLLVSAIAHVVAVHAY
ncbi:hypothetical protein [Piscinibacter sp.]|jgi:hypothetical protein|uniref:hypothetical protein n=1 Tax=Piscinibacter sp. TaxID=1903157 RepID=UPI00355AAC17